MVAKREDERIDVGLDGIEWSNAMKAKQRAIDLGDWRTPVTSDIRRHSLVSVHPGIDFFDAMHFPLDPIRRVNFFHNVS
ncbi:hypothetical protein CA13_02670 [Planctomycetes bacterium CA13]|uniref:Uncharacterized protein n=1 Tax=Novipirellula herctigrandis TaxID=2527986 RepID=A0A5C5YVK6_9BACT|nr:hypothetical protein CA13_02670 [Planctomycetes bacterium CA13]